MMELKCKNHNYEEKCRIAHFKSHELGQNPRNQGGMDGKMGEMKKRYSNEIVS